LACAGSPLPSGTTRGGSWAPSASGAPVSGSHSSASRPSSRLESAPPPATYPGASASPSSPPTRIDRASAGRGGGTGRDPARGAVRADRRHSLRCRRPALLGGMVTVAALAVLAVVFLAPNRLAGLQLGDVALGWWVAGAACLAGLGTVVWGFRGTGPTGVVAGTSRFAPFALAAVWSSPALWLALPPPLPAVGLGGLSPPTRCSGCAARPRA